MGFSLLVLLFEVVFRHFSPNNRVVTYDFQSWKYPIFSKVLDKDEQNNKIIKYTQSYVLTIDAKIILLLYVITYNRIQNYVTT